MGENSGDVPVKEIQNSVIHPLYPNSQFVDAVSEIVRFGAAEFVPQFLEPLDPDSALVLSLGRQGVQPFKHRYRAVIFLIERHMGFRHGIVLLSDPSHVRIIANACQVEASNHVNDHRIENSIFCETLCGSIFCDFLKLIEFPYLRAT